MNKEGKNAQPISILDEKAKDIGIIDTIFNDGTKFYCGFTDSIVFFVWWQSDDKYHEVIIDTLDVKSPPEFDFFPLIWKDNSIQVKNSFYRKRGLILFGYHYAPYGICTYFIKEKDGFVSRKKYLMNKWFSPLINENNETLITIHEDFSRENNSADGLLYFYGRKIKLKDYPDYANEDTIQFTNKNFKFECENELMKIDSCDWITMINSFPRMKKFLNSK